MINKSFDSVEKSDIDALVANEVREGRTLDYKEKLPGNSDGDKTEFLADVSSFANASGGYILYGIREKRDADGKPTGILESADGLDGVNADNEILRLESSIRTAIDPRVPGVRTKPIEGFSKGPVLVLWIPKSWFSPHVVTFKNHSRFYSRSSNGKYPLDVTEIRSAFALSESLPEKVRRFRDDRLAKIVADETPVPLQPCAKIVLHLLPIAALDSTTLVDITSLEPRFLEFQPFYPGGMNYRYNLDGFLTYNESGDSPNCSSYLQIFRSGAFEAVEARMLRGRNDKKSIPKVFYEEKLIALLDRYLKLQRSLGFDPPIFVMLSFLGVKGYVMGVDAEDGYPIDRDVLLLPDLIVEDYDSEAAKILRLAFDAVWQAAGLGRSMNYDKDGKWVRQ